MIIPRVEGILATTEDSVIGVDGKIPWKHSGDMKRFATITLGHALLIGVNTLLGVAEHHFKPGSIIFPGRKLIIPVRDIKDQADIKAKVQAFGKQLDHEGNVRFIFVDKTQPEAERSLLEHAVKHVLDPDQKLFIAGGAKIYESFLPFAETIHLTSIANIKGPMQYPDGRLITLTDKTADYFINTTWRREHVGFELDGETSANYFTLRFSRIT